METLDNTDWDIIIAGTGLSDSLLALALSRSGKKILHVDKNAYYGGTDAAFSLQEAQTWIERRTKDGGNGSLQVLEPERLSVSRSYSIALSPQVIYARSALLPALVSSRTDRQIDFVVLANWWVYTVNSDENSNGQGLLARVPNGREDLFAEESLDAKTKRSLIKFLRFVGNLEAEAVTLEENADVPFSEFLESRFGISRSVQGPIHALSMSSSSPDKTSTSYAILRIARHLRSIGLFGDVFGAVIPKWGGLSEIVQIACRYSAVGGGVYVLGTGVTEIAQEDASAENLKTRAARVTLTSGDKVTTNWIVSSQDNLPDVEDHAKVGVLSSNQADKIDIVSRSVCIVSTTLESLFSRPTGSSLPGAGAVISFPGYLFEGVDHELPDVPPVHIIAHSAETGDCPKGQSVLYASVAVPSKAGFKLLNKAVEMLLKSSPISETPSICWKLQYEHVQRQSANNVTIDDANHVIAFPTPSQDLVFDDSILERVQKVWQKLTGDIAEPFLKFDRRESLDSEDES